MDISCIPTGLIKAVSLANKVIPNNPTHLILLNVILKAEPEILKVEAFNGQIAMSWTVRDANINTPGEVAVNCKDFLTLLNSLKDEVAITLSADEEYLHLKSQKGKEAKFAKGDIEEMPWIDSLTEEEIEQVSIEADDLIQAVEETKYAAATEMAKAILCGVCLNFDTDEENTVEFAATDGHRLARTRVLYEPSENTPENKLVMPTETLTLTTYALKQMETSEEIAEMVTISFDESKIQVDFSEGFIRSRKLDGKYPDYEMLINGDDFSLDCTFNRKQLLEALKFIDTFAVGKDSLCFIDFDPEEKKCTLRSKENTTGSAEDTLEVEDINGQAQSLGFNSNYLKQCLKAMPRDTVTMQITETTGDQPGPVFISPSEEYNTFGLVMPIQITGN